MNSAQIHLALTHVPVILSLVGLVIMMIALVKKSNSLLKISYSILLFASLAAIPVFLSGEGTEELMERLPGVSEAIIERHEEVAKMAMISVVATGLVALAGLLLFRKTTTTRIIKIVALLLALSTGGLMTQSAHLGGQIRHTEIRNGSLAQIDTTNGADDIPNKREQEHYSEHDDD